MSSGRMRCRLASSGGTAEAGGTCSENITFNRRKGLASLTTRDARCSPAHTHTHTHTKLNQCFRLPQDPAAPSLILPQKLFFKMHNNLFQKKKEVRRQKSVFFHCAAFRLLQQEARSTSSPSLYAISPLPASPCGARVTARPSPLCSFTLCEIFPAPCTSLRRPKHLAPPILWWPFAGIPSHITNL